ncbi:DUF4915 domain-containing protein [Candidatus Pelagibacter sp. HIMB1321]|uniref:DUF4915 domain-containing protein n=1 Tax=Candidatus Pelagibacter sp. HIMB1321 TaxID=1388755 RepID=UPI000A07EBF7|nr:DUF4915 domain-containing protein [Candidatus Pelagibacter sp. HIMB1321]SMF79604.1 protein of unknown function [Candidatus Pelagibacter sp. HIMB1321]
MNIWLDWPILNKILKQKKRVYFFGRSEDWVPKTLSKIKKHNIKITVLDNNPSYKNTFFMDCKVENPSILKNFDFKKDYVIITAEPETIIPELKKYKLEEEKNFCCTPQIKEWGKLQEIKKNSSNVIFSSSDYFDLSKARSSKLGGGIFTANVAEQKYEKKIDGQYRQIIKYKEYYYVIEYIKKEVHIFDNKFKIIQKYNLDQSLKKNEKPNYCGITHIPQKKCFYVANTASDEISIYDQNNFKLIDKIIFSNKSKQFDDGQSHINDITSLGSSLFVSYFSRSGLWRKGIFDGGLSEIEIDNNNKVNNLISNLSQPHSPECLEGQIYVLDSFNKYLYHGTKKVSKFSGFVRGLAFDGSYFYIGQSEDMYLSKDMGTDINLTMCNAGIYQLDANKNIARFLSIPDIMNIHDILIID